VRTYFLSTLTKIGPPAFRRWVVEKLKFMKNLQKLKKITDTIHETSVQIIDAKKKALLSGDEAVAELVGAGKDIISILRMFSSISSF